MHTGSVPGTFTRPEGKARKTVCPHCFGEDVTVRLWESDDGAYEDWRFTCKSCGHQWWVEGPDA